jgi:hypothetical protein
MYDLERSEKEWLFAVNAYIKKYALIGSSLAMDVLILAKISLVGSMSWMSARSL